MYKFCHCLTKPIITRIIVSLVLENVIIRIEVTVFRDFITLVKYVQILSLFNQAHYYTNYCNQLTTSLLTTCNKRVFKKLSQAIRTHPDRYRLVGYKSVARCQN